MPAVSKAQQRFMGMVYAVKKGEMSAPSSEVAKAAASMKKKDAKDFASTKHKGLPKKKLEEIHKQAHQPHEIPSKNLKGLVKKAVKRIDTDVDGDTDHNDKAKGELGEFIPGVGNKRLYSTTRTKTAKEATDYSQRDKIMKRAKPLHKHLYKTLHKKDMSGDVNEESKYDRYDKEKKEFAKADRKMKFGKFYSKAKEAKNRLRPGEVKRYDKKLGRYVSNKD